MYIDREPFPGQGWYSCIKLIVYYLKLANFYFTKWLLFYGAFFLDAGVQEEHQFWSEILLCIK